MTDPKLTPLQKQALQMVQERPYLTIEEYANMMGNTEEIYKAFAQLIFQQHLKVNLVTGAVATKGII